MPLQWHLGEEEFFRDLPMEKKEFFSQSVRRPLRKNDFVFTEDEPATSCFYLEEGSVKISRITPWGKEPIIFVRKAGELFGLAEVIDGKKRKCDAQAISRCTLYEIQRDDFEALLSRHYPLARRVIEVMGRRLRYLAEQVENLMVCDVATRLSKLLVYLTYDQLLDEKSWQQPIIIPKNLTQEQLASLTGSTQQTVSETLKKFQEEGLIAVSRKEISILNPRKLLSKAEV